MNLAKVSGELLKADHTVHVYVRVLVTIMFSSLVPFTGSGKARIQNRKYCYHDILVIFPASFLILNNLYQICRNYS